MRRSTRDDPSGIDWPEEKTPNRPFFRVPELAEIERKIRESGMPAAEFHADLVIFLVISGLRSFEFGRLRAEDIEFDSQNGGGVIHAKGKRGGIRRIEVGTGDEDLVRRMQERCEDGPILTPSGLATVLKRWSNKLKDPRLSARALRRSFATDMSDGSDLRTIQAQMGHSTLATTEKYLGVLPERARAAADRRHHRLRGEP